MMKMILNSQKNKLIEILLTTFSHVLLFFLFKHIRSNFNVFSAKAPLSRLSMFTTIKATHLCRNNSSIRIERGTHLSYVNSGQRQGLKNITH